MISIYIRGRNIFITPDGKDDFRIIDDKIHLTDWEGNKCILDLEGNLLYLDRQNESICPLLVEKRRARQWNKHIV